MMIQCSLSEYYLSFPINVFARTNLDDADNEPVVFDGIKNAIVSDAKPVFFFSR